MPRTNAAITSLHELDSPPWKRVDGTIIEVADGIKALYERRFAEIDLTFALATLVAYLHDFGPVTQTRAADHLSRGRAVTGSQIDRLEGIGLLERMPDPTDRRVWMIQLTPAGIKAQEAVVRIDKVVRAELRSGTDRKERQQLAKLLMRLEANISTALKQ